MDENKRVDGKGIFGDFMRSEEKVSGVYERGRGEGS